MTHDCRKCGTVPCTCATVANDEQLPPLLPKHAVGNVEAIHYLYLYGDGEVFAKPEKFDSDWMVKLSPALLLYDSVNNEWHEAYTRCSISIGHMYTLVPRAEVDPEIVEVFEELKVGE